MLISYKAHKGNLSAKDRAEQFARVTHEDCCKLFCIVCNQVIDHNRKSIVENHLNSQKHRKKALDQEKKTEGR